MEKQEGSPSQATGIIFPTSQRSTVEDPSSQSRKCSSVPVYFFLKKIVLCYFIVTIITIFTGV
ncbi:hypothetical protein ANCCAN_00154 [Ancylostoma caninum]|uniref:Uncharacterized protein n=1 Tax=Ancylostoma caninum TaxID=29170 RepID=A0A368HE16_ANCCA|nr:hypothetical protein ANCCAN_00154 [Ancylostoma caninum]